MKPRLTTLTGTTQTQVSGTANVVPSDEPARLCGETGAMTVAQIQMQLRAPTSETYVQMPRQRGFRKLGSGESLSSLDCIEIECPASFPPDATCWRCREQIKAPD
jgi:hypothetical protein